MPAKDGHPARIVAVHVGFAMHVFTCEIEDAGANPEVYRDDREERAFNAERYDASFQLEALIRDLGNRKCFFSKNENFFTVELQGAPEGFEYRVFFIVRKRPGEGHSVDLIVQSAYHGRLEQRPKGQRRKPVGFRVILASALLGKDLKEPP